MKDNPTSQLSITLPQSLIKDSKEYCKKNLLTLSGLIRTLLKIEVYNEKVFMKGNKNEA